MSVSLFLQHMDKVSMLAFHPVKMQSCYEKMEQLSLEGLQQRFEVSSPSVFIQRAQILMREVNSFLYFLSTWQHCYHTGPVSFNPMLFHCKYLDVSIHCICCVCHWHLPAIEIDSLTKQSSQNRNISFLIGIQSTQR